jgi:short-subunit dehydrogenase
MAVFDQEWNPARILLTGASSGIGAALAEHLAAPGRRLHLGGRESGRLEAVAARCRAKGAEAVPRALDLRERAALGDWVELAGALDLVIANAGVSGRREDSTELVAVNLQALIDLVEAALPEMLRQGRGQLALMSSLAGFRGMPAAPVYSAVKAAARVYGEALRGRLRRAGIAVSVICPGFVTTPMTADNPFPMPLLMPPERAAAIIARGLARRRPLIAFPRRLYWGVRLLGLLPPCVADPLLARLPAKE